MVIIFETETILVDPNSAPVTQIFLNKSFIVLQIAIISNTVRANGVREITLGITYDNGFVSSFTYSLETFIVGNNIPDITNAVLMDGGNIIHVEFIEHTIKNDTVAVTVLTLAQSGTNDNRINSKKLQLDPSNPITTGIPFEVGTPEESILVNVGSLTKTPDVASGTMNAVVIEMSEV